MRRTAPKFRTLAVMLFHRHHHHLFVYGTLHPSLAPAHLRGLLAAWHEVGPGSVPGLLYDFGPYPGVVFSPMSTARVRGMVFAVPADPAHLAELDHYEGIEPGDEERSLFVRRVWPVVLDDGAVLDCWVYAYNRDPSGARLVPDGDWRAWLRRSARR